MCKHVYAWSVKRLCVKCEQVDVLMCEHVFVFMYKPVYVWKVCQLDILFEILNRLCIDIVFLIFQTEQIDRKKPHCYKSDNWPQAVCIGSNYEKIDLYWFSNKFEKKPNRPNRAHPYHHPHIFTKVYFSIQMSYLINWIRVYHIHTH